MVGLPDGEKIEDNVYSFLQNPRTWQTHTQTHTHTAWRLRPPLHNIARHKLLQQVYWRRYKSRSSSKPKLHLKKQNNNIWRKTIFNMADGIITPCNVAQSWLWNHDSEFTKWQHPAMWYVALGWHAMEFAQTSAILEFCIWFRFWPYHRSWHVILHQFVKFYPNRTTLGRKQWRHVDFQDGGSQPFWIFGVQ